jgi:hypothetical protein
VVFVVQLEQLHLSSHKVQLSGSENRSILDILSLSIALSLSNALGLISPLIQVNKPLCIRTVYTNKFKRDYISNNINKLYNNITNWRCARRMVTSSQPIRFCFQQLKTSLFAERYSNFKHMI